MPNGIIVNLTKDGRTAIVDSMTSSSAITISSVKFYSGTPTVIDYNIDPSTDPTLGTLIAQNSSAITVSATNNLLQIGTYIELESGISSTTAQTMLIGFNKEGDDDGVLAYSTFEATSLVASMSFVTAISVEGLALEQVTFSNIPFTNIPEADTNLVGGIAFAATLLIQDGLLQDTNNGQPITLRPSQVQEFVQGKYWYGSITISSSAITDRTVIKRKDIVISNNGKIATSTTLSGTTISILEGRYLPLNSTSAATPYDFIIHRDSNIMLDLPLPPDGSYNLFVKETVL